MIPAKKRAIFDSLARCWVTWALRRQFHAVYLAGKDHLDALSPGLAVVGCVNHTNWWDGFVLYVLSARRLPHDIYLAMEERNLRSYGFFTWLGVFGVDPSSGARNLRALRYAVNLLRNRKGHSAALVWMFVQGRLVGERRRIEAQPGAAFLARHSGAVLLPLVLRYAWLSESRPSVFIRVGAPLAPDSKSETISTTLNELAARTDETLDPPTLGAYEPLFEPRMSINKRWDYVRHLLLRRRESFDKSNR